MRLLFNNMNQKTIGNFGENLACKYLENKNYKILGRNIKVSRLELDIIASKSKKIDFFEVKTRIKNSETEKDIFLGAHQIKNLKKATIRYAALHKINFEFIRFNLIVILLDRQNKTALIKHYPDIF